MKNFRTYDLAVQFYRATATLSLPSFLRDQLARAASSIVLNLAEGVGRQRGADQRRFYKIAFGSLRESQAILELASPISPELMACADKLGAHLYRLIQNTR